MLHSFNEVAITYSPKRMHISVSVFKMGKMNSEAKRKLAWGSVVC